MIGTLGTLQGPSSALKAIYLSLLYWCAFPALTLAVALGIVLSGRMDGALVCGGAACALVGVWWGTYAPNSLLRVLFLAAPLLWGLGDLARSSSAGLRVNVPMVIGLASAILLKRRFGITSV